MEKSCELIKRGLDFKGDAMKPDPEPFQLWEYVVWGQAKATIILIYHDTFSQNWVVIKCGTFYRKGEIKAIELRQTSSSSDCGEWQFKGYVPF